MKINIFPQFNIQNNGQKNFSANNAKCLSFCAINPEALKHLAFKQPMYDKFLSHTPASGVDLEKVQTICSEFLEKSKNVIDAKASLINLRDFYRNEFCEIIDKSPHADYIRDAVGNLIWEIFDDIESKMRSQQEIDGVHIAKDVLGGIEAGIKAAYDKTFELKCLEKV